LGIQGNPLQFARDIADGYAMISPSSLKSLAISEIKTIKQSIGIIQREIRAGQVPLEDVMAVKKKNMRLQRLNQALMLVENFCKRQRIPV